jgi:hypothetical protein
MQWAAITAVIVAAVYLGLRPVQVTSDTRSTGGAATSTTLVSEVRWRAHLRLPAGTFADLDGDRPVLGRVGDLANLSTPGLTNVFSSTSGRVGIAPNGSPSFDQCRVAVTGRPMQTNLRDVPPGQVLCVITSGPPRHLAAVRLTAYTRPTAAMELDVTVWREPVNP